MQQLSDPIANYKLDHVNWLLYMFMDKGVVAGYHLIDIDICRTYLTHDNGQLMTNLDGTELLAFKLADLPEGGVILSTVPNDH